MSGTWLTTVFSTHRSLIRGVHCEFLPPYSSDYNPIELTFSWMKYYLHHYGDYTHLALTGMLYHEIYICLLKALYSISLEDIHSWYRHCGYI
jgi:transposase